MQAWNSMDEHMQHNDERLTILTNLFHAALNEKM